MTLIRWTPARSTGLMDLRSEMDRLFDSFLSTRSLPSESADTVSPPVDIEETPEAFVLRGDQIKATYRDGVLEIRVPKAEEARMREIEVQVG